MSEFKVNTITNRDGSYGPQVCGITTFGSSGMQLPSGPTEFRGGRGRGIFAGREPSASNIDKIEIATTGNSVTFGTLSRSKQATSATASSTRGVVFGGYSSPTYYTDIEYITISSSGGANDFGDLIHDRGWSAACGDGIRGIVAGSWPGPATIEYVNIATTGDANEFGELSVRPAGFTGVQNGHEITGGCGSPTRGIFGGGAFGSPSTTATNLIQFINIKTLGNSVKFGELNNLSYGVSASSNSTRGLFYGGRTPSIHDTIDYITIATEGNATDFGNLLANRRDTGACASSIRGIVAGGKAPSSHDNVIQYVTIASTGNATDFGDLTSTRSQMGGFSDVHGGLAR
jgi:hypothetical protein